MGGNVADGEGPTVAVDVHDKVKGEVAVMRLYEFLDASFHRRSYRQRPLLGQWASINSDDRVSSQARSAENTLVASPCPSTIRG